MIRICIEWLCALLALILIILCTLISCVCYVGLCIYWVAFRVSLLSESADRRTNENAP